MKIAILGTRGVPNTYGGFEQFAEYLSIGLAKRGHDVTVYNPHTHSYKDKVLQGVNIQRIFDPEKKIGTSGQFVYDFLSILHTRTKNFDIILQLGYTSSSLFFDFHPSNTLIVTNMDGLEWKRSKYSKRTQQFLTLAEKLAVQKSHHLIADSLGIQTYLKETYGASSHFLPYGATLFQNANESVIQSYDLTAYHYNMVLARLEPENNIEVILQGHAGSSPDLPLIVIGNQETTYGRYLVNKFEASPQIRFLGTLYDIDILNHLRHFSNLYFHGHSVGGTNPSLLEAMASNALICAHNNIFNRSILGDDAFYFQQAEDITSVNQVTKDEHQDKLANNLMKIKEVYDWDVIIDNYEHYLQNLLATKC